MNIRLEDTVDIPAIHRVEQAAFGRAAEADLVDVLRANGKATLSLVAEEGGEIVGHVFFSPVALRTENGEHAALGLGPVAVLPERQGQGIGSALIRRGLEMLPPELAVFLEGSPKYYPRFGFVDAAEFGIKCQFNPPPGCFMVHAPVPEGLLGLKGTIYYSEEFETVE